MHVKAHHPNSVSATSSPSPLVVCPICDLRVAGGLRALRQHLKIHGAGSPDLNQRSTKSRPLATGSRLDRRKLVFPFSEYLTRSKGKSGTAMVGKPQRGLTKPRHHGLVHSQSDRYQHRHYICCYCEAAFTKPHRLIAHLQVHETETTTTTTMSTPSRKDSSVKLEDHRNVTESSDTDMEESSNVSGTCTPPEAQSTATGAPEGVQGKRLLSCPYCAKRFKRRRQWMMHLKTHQNSDNGKGQYHTSHGSVATNFACGRISGGYF